MTGRSITTRAIAPRAYGHPGWNHIDTVGLVGANDRTRWPAEAEASSTFADRWQGSARVFEDYGTRNLSEVLALGDAIEFRQRLSG